ncbi:MAG: GNAT family N-acetyltransferase [Chloroflexia bacterium]|nr:GNAT family N-acetyltransferase [Chloroflexia bacterium]
MPADIVVRPYAASDEAELVALWNESMWADPIDRFTWRTRYLLDANFDTGECLVAVEAEANIVVGFVLGMTNKSSTSRMSEPPDAWVVGFGVDDRFQRQGIGRALFDRLQDRWSNSGIARIMVGPYIPSYFTPGVDERAYPDAVTFLHAWGAETLSRPLSMKASLTGYRAADVIVPLAGRLQSAGIRVRPAEPRDIVPLLQFLERHFPHWRPDAAAVLMDLMGTDPRFVTMHVAEEHGTLVGYAQSRHERFGPFGVDEAYRGRGVGAVLLSATLLAMRSKGFHCAWFLWTSDRAARLYREHGFEEVRRFALMAKAIATGEVPR